MHAYRTHNCAALRDSDVGATVRLSGWVHRKRDHGGVLFVDLRDHHGLTQIVAKAGSEALRILDGLRAESVVTVDGDVVARGTRGGQPEPGDRRDRGGGECRHRAVGGAGAADAGRGEAEYPEDIRPAATASSICAASASTPISCSDRTSFASIRQRMIAQGFTNSRRRSDASARKARATTGAEPRPSRQSSTRSRRRRRCSSS
jgi:aspartyl-tRNA synthetase